ncbi:MAG: helix-turn-helix domain-containing protein [Lachnospiraceae bacterium]|nr:helix-turn-helix domain-containing protein [Lachnospiraceae bacterium]
MDLRDTLLKLREDTGMNRRQFADYYGIPYRTLQDWELGNRKMPVYLLRLMIYKAEMEKLVDNGKSNK